MTALFFAQNFDAVKSVQANFVPTEAVSIQKVQEIVKDLQLQADLAFISGNLAFLSIHLKTHRSGWLAFGRSLQLIGPDKVQDRKHPQ